MSLGSGTPLVARYTLECESSPPLLMTDPDDAFRAEVEEAGT